MIRATVVTKGSPFLGEECALCKHPLAPGDELVICPNDGSRHHVHCWQANNNRCTNYGCTGRGEVVRSAQPADPEMDELDEFDETDAYADDEADYDEFEEQAETAGSGAGRGRRSKVLALPSSSLGCAQSCLLVSIALAILLFAVGCFGLWAIADYILIELLDWQYRAPINGWIPFLFSLTAVFPF